MIGLRFGLMTVLAALMLALAPQAAAQDLGSGPHIAMRLEAESATPAPGSTVTLALVSAPQPGWHGYWANPGDAGLPAKLDWHLPAGVTAGALRYPIPERLLIAGIMNYAFEGPYAPLVPVTIPANAKPGSRLPVGLEIDYLVCTNEVCVPERQQLSTLLTVGDGGIDAASRARFDGYRAALPRPLGSDATYQVRNGRFRLGVPFPAGAAIGDAYFFAKTDGVVDYAAPQTVARDGDRLVIDTAGKAANGAIDGVLALGKGRGGVEIHAVPGSVAPAPAQQAATGESPVWRVALIAFLSAVLGGLVLNIMPCVFPILSLKALSLAKAGGDRAHHEALAYSAGVILVCLALGGLLLGLRAGGATVGWAFQLQDPRVILILLLLVTAIALNLAGLFELSAPGVVNRAAARGTGGAFATGALAALIATPCTGPFMGAALGAALVLPWPAALAIFAGLGLGIALPFLLIGFIPALRRRLPKPGAWMETLRRILSVPMFATALGLAWVLGRQAGVSGMTFGLAAALAFALGLWWTGMRQLRGRSRAWVPALALGVAALGGTALVQPVAAVPAAAAAGSAQPFSEARLAELRQQGRPVFAYFTADWCLSCKVNEKIAIDTAPVQQAFAANKVAVLVGDWTDGDPALGRFLSEHGRAGVPLYLWYRPGAAEPEVLPQILSQSGLEARAAAR